MADDKKYYYLKLKDNFFDSDAMIILESMQDGYMYSNILLKLYLRSLKFQGRLMFNEKIPYNSTVLAQVTRHNVGVIEKAFNIFQELGLIEVLDNGAIYMLDIQNFIGESSTEADRKREYRLRIEVEKDRVGQMSGQISDKYPPKIEIEKELELDKDIKIYSPVIEYLNQKCNTKYRTTTAKTKSLIKSRVDEGFVLEDFKKVIDIKTAEWLDDSKMNKFLRPETLFGTKFESYLNQKTKESEGKYGNRIKFDVPEVKRKTRTTEEIEADIKELGLI